MLQSNTKITCVRCTSTGLEFGWAQFYKLSMLGGPNWREVRADRASDETINGVNKIKTK